MLAAAAGASYEVCVAVVCDCEACAANAWRDASAIRAASASAFAFSSAKRFWKASFSATNPSRFAISANSSCERFANNTLFLEKVSFNSVCREANSFSAASCSANFSCWASSLDSTCFLSSACCCINSRFAPIKSITTPIRLTASDKLSAFNKKSKYERAPFVCTERACSSKRVLRSAITFSNLAISVFNVSIASWTSAFLAWVVSILVCTSDNSFANVSIVELTADFFSLMLAIDELTVSIFESKSCALTDGAKAPNDNTVPVTNTVNKRFFKWFPPMFLTNIYSK